ncbi:MAG: YkgJ family cysteine cluster protein [Campylobacterales bacterium]|nr:YkgJ family cysteine cluster protein [Campylobacterales bacterium]
MKYPEKIGTFQNTSNKTFYFSSCANCGSKCCAGSENFVLAPLILEDFELVYENFPILFREQDGLVKASIVLNNGESGCWYLGDNGCNIYSKRPSTCKQFPLSPYFDELYIDGNCPAVSECDGIKMIENNQVLEPFKVDRFDGFNKKLEETDRVLNSFNKENFQYFLTIKGIALFTYLKKDDNKYIDLHQKSLQLHEEKLKILVTN